MQIASETLKDVSETRRPSSWSGLYGRGGLFTPPIACSDPPAPAQPTWPLRNMFLFFRRYDPGHGVLTTLHPIVLYQCLGARAYSEAHDVLLRADMQRAPRKAMELAPQDVLEYFYLGALVLTKLQMFGRAIEFFEQVSWQCLDCCSLQPGPGGATANAQPTPVHRSTIDYYLSIAAGRHQEASACPIDQGWQGEGSCGR